MIVTNAIVFIAIFACLGYSKEVSETADNEPNDKSAVEKVLQQFLKLTEEHKLNISVIVSTKHYHHTRRLKSLNDVAMLTPPIKIQLKESTLTKQVQEKWIEEILENTDEEIGRPQARNVDVNSDIVEGFRLHCPESASYQWITNYDKTLGRQAFSIDNPNVHIWYNFDVESPEKHHVKMVASNITVKVVARGPKLTSAAEDVLLSSIRKLWHMFDDDTEYAKAIGRVLDKVVPDKNWQVVVGSEHFNVPTEHWILLKVIDQHVLVYAGKE